MATPIDTTALADQVLTALRASLAANWPQVATLAAGESFKLAQTGLTIQQMSANGELFNEAAATLLDMQKNATRAVLCAASGIAIIDAEKAINAALAVVAAAVNKSIGFPLL